jgi:hypothetical protein
MSFKAVKFRAAHGYDPDVASDEAVVVTDPISLTVQAHAVDADINVMLERFRVTGQVSEGSIRVPEFGDFSGVTDFQSALHVLSDATDNFNKLDAKVRARFQNSPQLFMEFCADKENLDDMRKMGLAVPKPVEDVKP